MASGLQTRDAGDYRVLWYDSKSFWPRAGVDHTPRWGPCWGGIQGDTAMNRGGRWVFPWLCHQRDVSTAEHSVHSIKYSHICCLIFFFPPFLPAAILWLAPCIQPICHHTAEQKRGRKGLPPPPPKLIEWHRINIKALDGCDSESGCQRAHDQA